MVTSHTTADEIVQHQPDTTAGKMVGGWSSFLVGGVIAGPIGAIVAGTIGAWSGGNIQSSINASGDSYLVKKDDGSTQLVRSPNQQFQLGEQVHIQGLRAYPAAR